MCAFYCMYILPQFKKVKLLLKSKLVSWKIKFEDFFQISRQKMRWEMLKKAQTVHKLHPGVPTPVQQE